MATGQVSFFYIGLPACWMHCLYSMGRFQSMKHGRSPLRSSKLDGAAQADKKHKGVPVCLANR